MSRNYSSTAVQTSLSAPATAADATLAVSSTAGFPVVPYILALDYGAASQELVLVTGVSGTNLTVTRGYDSTTAQTHDTGAVVAHTHAAIDFREAAAHADATVGVHGTSGALVGTGGVQTLTNKTLSVDDNTVNGLPPSSFVMTDATGRVVSTESRPALMDPGVGEVRTWIGATDPNANWMVMDGRAVSRTTYAALFALIGTTHGTGDGSTTFNIPNAKGRVLVGLDGADAKFDALGEKGGASQATLAETNLPAHTHAIDHNHASFFTPGDGVHDHGHMAAPSTGGLTGGLAMGGGTFTEHTGVNGVTSTDSGHSHIIDVPAFTGTSGSTGSGTAFSVQNPYLTVNHILRVA